MRNLVISLLLSITFLKVYGQDSNTSISGNFLQLSDQDSVRLDVYQYGQFPFLASELKTSYRAKVKDHSFTLLIPLHKNRIYECWITIPKLSVQNNLRFLLLEKGDQIHIGGTATTVQDFKGRGSNKLNILRNINRIAYAAEITKAERTRSCSGLPLIITNSEKVIRESNLYLTKQRNKIDKIAFEALQMQIQQNVWRVYSPIHYNYDYFDKDSVRHILADTWLPFRNHFISQLNSKSALYDFYYTENLIYDFFLKQIIHYGNFDGLNANGKLKEMYSFYKLHYSGLLREKIITYLILSAPHSNDVTYCYEDAIKYITTKDFRTALDNRCRCIPGSLAYNFTLADTNKIIRHLADYKGKVVVLDFWFTGCGGCRELAPKLKLVEDQFKGNDKVVFISISSDKNLSTWKNSIKGGYYTISSDEINLYSNGNGVVDPLYKKCNIQSVPTLKVIDKNGKWCDNPNDCRNDNGKDLIALINKALRQ